MKTITFFVIKYVVLIHAQWNAPIQRITENMCVGRMDEIVFPDPENCDMFVRCQRGTVMRQRCQPGTSFDLNLYYCVPHHVVNCGQRKQLVLLPPPIAGEAPPSAESHHSVCRSIKNGALIANPQNCRAYIECQQNLRLDRECESGELFEAKSGVCLSDFAVDCGNRKISPSNSDVAMRNVCLGQQNNARIANPRDCRRYFNCLNQQGNESECKPGELFEINLGRCVNERVVNCGSRVINRIEEIPPRLNDGIPVSICQGQTNGRKLENPENCRSFIECLAGVRVGRICDSGNLFDTQREACMPANFVRCGSRKILPVDNELQSPEDFFPPCPKSGVLFRSHPHDCQGYFICLEGNLIQHSCSPGMYFNPQTLKCDFPKNVQCRLQTIVVPQTPLLPDCSSGANFFPNLVNCKQYYKCVNNLPQLVDCPQGHLWNNLQLRCDKSESEVCARKFDNFRGTFTYSKPNENEKNG